MTWPPGRGTWRLERGPSGGGKATRDIKWTALLKRDPLEVVVLQA